jgi:hypothetical protein
MSKVVWLIELDVAPTMGGVQYLSTAVSDDTKTVGFTEDPFRAWQFPSRAAAELVRQTIKMGDRVCDHMFVDGEDHDTAFERHQRAAAERGNSFYGDGGTIHGTGHLAVITDIEGNVLAVEFRCLRLPFKQVVAGLGRSREIRFGPKAGISICGVEYRKQQ